MVFFKVSFSNRSLLVHRNTIYFCVFTFYLETLLNSLILTVCRVSWILHITIIASASKDRFSFLFVQFLKPLFLWSSVFEVLAGAILDRSSDSRHLIVSLNSVGNVQNFVI